MRARSAAILEPERRTTKLTKVTKVGFVFFVIFVVPFVVVPVSGQSEVVSPWAGTWTLNLAKSSYTPGPPPFRRGTVTIEPWAGVRDEGRMKITFHMVRPRGGITHLEWIGAFDGRDYPLQGVEDYAVTAAYRPLDDRTLDFVQKADGSSVVTGKMTVSPDGRTLTIATAGSTAVYDRAGS
jgi:hypothetical protein